MISNELADELREIAFCEDAYPKDRVAALNSLAKQGLDVDRVRDDLYSIATSYNTPDAIKIRAIDILDKLDVRTAPKDLSKSEAERLRQDLVSEYVRKA